MILTPDSEYRAVLDACTLIPMPLCDTLLRLAEEPALYLPLWSEEILRETKEGLRRLGCTFEQQERRITAMKRAFPEALVDIPDEIVQAVKNLPDNGDRHVVAVAIKAHADAIVTVNAKHFPKECLERYGVLCQSVDDFLVHQLSLSRDRVLGQLDYQATNIKEERQSIVGRLAKLAPRFAELVK